MAIQNNPQADGRRESEGKRWAIDGIPLRTPLKPLSTNSAKNKDGGEDEEECSTTPIAEEARIPNKLPCPPAPRKRRPVKSQSNVVREFFVTPPDLESVFKPHVSC